MSVTFLPDVTASDITRVIAGCTPVLNIPNSVGGFGRREIYVVVTPSPTARVYDDGTTVTTKYYRTYTVTTSYSVSDGSTTYTRTITDETTWAEGWHTDVTDVIAGTTTTVTDTSTNTYNDTGWSPSDPAVSFSSTPTVTETATLITSVYAVTSSGFTGNKTITQEWTDLVTEAELISTAQDLVPADLSGYAELYDWFDNNSLDSMAQWLSVLDGEKRLGVVEYCMGTVCCRDWIAGTEVVITDVDGVVGETYTPTLYECTNEIDASTKTLGATWSLEQPKYRGDHNQLFSDWRRLSPFDYGTTADEAVYATLYVVPYAGHPTSPSTGYCNITSNIDYWAGNQFLTPPQ